MIRPTDPRSGHRGRANEEPAFLEGGLPEWMTSPKFIFLAILALMSLFSMAAAGVKALSESVATTEVPQCYATIRPYAPGNRFFDRYNNYKYAGYEKERKKDVARLQTAIDRCEVGACSKPDQTVYRRALTHYVGGKALATQVLHRYYGDPGLAAAHYLYDGGEDYSVAQDLRARIEANDLKWWHKSRTWWSNPGYTQAAKLIAFKSNEEFVHCLM